MIRPIEPVRSSLTDDRIRVPRLDLLGRGTPLLASERLGAAIGLPGLWVKRDDLTGTGLGGNKIRKLEFLLADAISRNATHLLTAAGLQSNFVRQAGAACAQLGLRLEAFVEAAVIDDERYRHSGNVLLDGLFGVQLRQVDRDASGALQARLAALRDRSVEPYVLPSGGSNGLGALGYVLCAIEMVAQWEAAGFVPSTVVVTTGSGGTHAGLMAGLHLCGATTSVVGVAISEDGAEKKRKVTAVLHEVCQLLRIESSELISSVRVADGHQGPGYGYASPECIEAIRLAARTEGLVLDPVYTGKAMAGLLAMVRSGAIPCDRQVVFLHSGGAPALFAYAEHFRSDGALSSVRPGT